MKKNDHNARDSFVFYRSFYDSIRQLPDETQLVLFQAIANYGLDCTPVDFEGVDNRQFVEAIWAGMKPQLDANYKRYLNGCKGGPPIGSHNNPNGRRGKKTNQELTKNLPNDNDNVNVNENVLLPYPDDKVFVDTWNVLRSTPKWKKKSTESLRRALKQLSSYDVLFAVELMNRAIVANYPGLVYPNTPEEYEKWKIRNNITQDQDEEIIEGAKHLYD